ncbi:FhaA domain-containing protein [Pseudofrankia saprophytica]|uniref:FhaA domain-containing protein n=1 Tax=Pseudofrankia saprophytica TaxID=298655 RepID=UPI000234BAB9|nr:FhaA domain-containing protein [Pseudofrankia saprophytica]
MGVLQRFERRLGGLVEGAFAKVFKGGVEPVEIAGALARETDDRRAISSNRVLVPNQFAVELANGDYARLAPYARALCDELAEMVREHAAEQRYTFVGPVSVKLSEAQDLDVGVFRIRSSVASADPGVVAGPRGAAPRATPGTPHLMITSKDAPPGAEREYSLTGESTLIGRSVECDIRLTDTGVSRQHGEIRRMPDGNFLYVDAGSTNGSIVNGRPATQVKLVNGDLIELGNALITFVREDARPARTSTPPPPEHSRRPGGQEPYRPRERDRDRRPEPPPYADHVTPRPEPYADRVTPRPEPVRDIPPPPGRPDPYADRERPHPRGDQPRDRSNPRGEPYRDAPPPVPPPPAARPERPVRPGRPDSFVDRSGPPRGERYREEADRVPSNPRNEPYRDGGGRDPRDGHDARNVRSRQGVDTDLYPDGEDEYGPGRRADGRPRGRYGSERYGSDRSSTERPGAERPGTDRPGAERRGTPRGANGFDGPPAERVGPGRGGRDDRAQNEIYDAETELPGRTPARPRPDDHRRRPGPPPPSDRSW